MAANAAMNANARKPAPANRLAAKHDQDEDDDEESSTRRSFEAIFIAYVTELRNNK